MKNMIVTLCVFRACEYGAGVAGFLKAFKDGAVYPVEADHSDCNYRIMYSVQAAVAATAKCVNTATIEMGVYCSPHKHASIDEIEYASIDEIDGIVSKLNTNYESIAEGLELALVERQKQKKNLAFATNAYQMLNHHDSFDEKITFEKLVSIGEALDGNQLSPSGSTLRFDNERMIWVGKPTEPKYTPDCNTGLPKTKISMYP